MPSSASPQVRVPPGAPPAQLSFLMHHYRQWRLAFDLAWETALEQVSWQSKREEREWRLILETTREGWRAAYDRWPPEPRELAVGTIRTQLADLLGIAA